MNTAPGLPGIWIGMGDAHESQHLIRGEHFITPPGYYMVRVAVFGLFNLEYRKTRTRR